METQKIPLSKKGQRKLSSFLAQELLYDYATGHLDGERKKAVEETLNQHRELKADLDKIAAGIRYAESLAKKDLVHHLHESIDQPETYLSVLLKKTNYEQWPLTVKWGIEAGVVLSVLILFLVLVPWDRAAKLGFSPAGREIILAEISRESYKDRERLQEIEKQEKGFFEDEGAKVAAKPEPVKPATAAAKNPTAPAPLQAKSGTVAKAPEAAAPAAEAKKAGEGGLYRGNLSVTNLKVTGTKITDKIQELGGRKAGEVELGWRKTPSSAYYHFTMPEAKYEELNKFLEGYGKIKLQKEKHPRIMPDGIIRLIITVEEAKP